MRTRNGKWEHTPSHDNKNMYPCAPDDLLYHLKCVLTPARADGLKGAPQEVVEFCGLSERMSELLCLLNQGGVPAK